MTNQKESGRKAIHHKVGVDNSFSAALCIGECFFSPGSVYTLKYPSLAVVLVYMRTVQKYCCFCVVHKTDCCKRTPRHFFLAAVSPSFCQSVHVFILILTFILRPTLTTNIIPCHSFTLLLGLCCSNRITLLPN